MTRRRCRRRCVWRRGGARSRRRMDTMLPQDLPPFSDNATAKRWRQLGARRLCDLGLRALGRLEAGRLRHCSQRPSYIENSYRAAVGLGRALRNSVIPSELGSQLSAKIVRIGPPGPKIFFACGALIREARCARGSWRTPPLRAPPSPPRRVSPPQARAGVPR